MSQTHDRIENVRRSGPCPIRFVVRENSNPDLPPIYDKTGDHNDRFFREWMEKTTWWALRNDKSVSTYPHP